MQMIRPSSGLATEISPPQEATGVYHLLYHFTPYMWYNHLVHFLGEQNQPCHCSPFQIQLKMISFGLQGASERLDIIISDAEKNTFSEKYNHIFTSKTTRSFYNAAAPFSYSPAPAAPVALVVSAPGR